MKAVFKKPLNMLAKVTRLFRFIGYMGNKKYCPLCKRGSSHFMSFGVPARTEACCFFCHSLERHRFLWLYLQRRTDFFSRPPSKFLHFAPEACTQKHFRKLLGAGYLTADIEEGKAMVQLDITDIAYPDESFDAILCSHVMEHVQDDTKAMRELYRVLKPDAWALLVVPLSGGETTFEDPSIVDPRRRFELFGQSDHVRVYGDDFSDRLQAVGFSVERIAPGDILTREELDRFSIPAAGAGCEIHRVLKNRKPS